MASAPAFTSAARIGVANISAANTNRDGSGTLVDVVTGVAAGTKITSVVVKAEDNPADSIVILWLYDGTNNFLFDEIDLGDPADADNVTTAFRYRKEYEDLVLPTASWKLKATLTAAPTAGDVNVFAFGGDLT